MNMSQDYDDRLGWEISREEEEYWQAHEEHIEMLGLAEEEERYAAAKADLDRKVMALYNRAHVEKDEQEAARLRTEAKNLKADLAKLRDDWETKCKDADAKFSDLVGSYGLAAAVMGLRNPATRSEWLNKPILPPPTPEERAAREKRSAEFEKKLLREASLERRRSTRHGKPDPRFARDGRSEVQRISGNEKLIRLFERPGASTSSTHGRSNPYWLEKAEPGAVEYVVWARDKKHARLLVKLDVRSPKGPLPGVRQKSTVPAGSLKKRKKAG